MRKVTKLFLATELHSPKRRRSLIIMQKCLVLASAVIVTLNTTWVINSQQGLDNSVEPYQTQFETQCA
jgi:flagellar basal body-associated protein FliL